MSPVVLQVGQVPDEEQGRGSKRGREDNGLQKKNKSKKRKAQALKATRT